MRRLLRYLTVGTDLDHGIDKFIRVTEIWQVWHGEGPTWSWKLKW